MRIQTKICELELKETQMKIDIHRIRREIALLKEEEKRQNERQEDEN